MKTLAAISLAAQRCRFKSTMDRPRHAQRLCHLFKMTEGRCDGEDSRQYRMTKRTCGTCSLCCKLPYVRELNKSIDTWCKHANPGRGGCLIYPDRPASCRSFICGWLSGAEVGDEWFPARCKMFITSRPSEGPAKKGILVTVDPAYPDAWRRNPYHAQLRAWAQHMFVEIRVGRRFIGLNADGTERQVTRTQAWIEGRDE